MRMTLGTKIQSRSKKAAKMNNRSLYKGSDPQKIAPHVPEDSVQDLFGVINEGLVHEKCSLSRKDSLWLRMKSAHTSVLAP